LQGHLTNTKQSRVNSDAAQALASSPKDVLKSTVFSCCRKVKGMVAAAVLKTNVTSSVVKYSLSRVVRFT